MRKVRYYVKLLGARRVLTLYGQEWLTFEKGLIRLKKNEATLFPGFGFRIYWQKSKVILYRNGL